MEQNTRIPHVAVTVNESDINGGALEILKVIRPQWNEEDVEFKLFTDGITNKLVGCRPRDVAVSETILVRVYGNKTDLLIDRKAETRNIILLGSLGLAPALYATFQNGLAYQFVPGHVLTDEMANRSDIYRLVAVRMARLHRVRVPGVADPPAPFLWTKLKRFLHLVPDRFSDPAKEGRFRRLGGPSKAELGEEIEMVKGALTEVGSPVVFCHNDLLLANVIYTEEEHCVTFIDYEYAAYNYQAFDIANHFAEYAGVGEVDYGKCPKREVQLDWLRIYLEEFGGEFTEDDVQRMYVQVNRFLLIVHIFWGIWALIQAEHSYIDFDFLGYAIVRFNEYFAKKEEMMKLELPR